MSKTTVQEIEPPIGLDSQQVLIPIMDVKVNAHIMGVWVRRYVTNGEQVKVELYDEANLVATCPDILTAAQVDALVTRIKLKGTPQ